MADHEQDRNTRPALRWNQFSLGSILALMTALSVVYAMKRDRPATEILIGTCIFVLGWVATGLAWRWLLGK